MVDDAVDPRWPKLLSLTVHEFRTPVTVVAGYLRMLLKERAGPLPEEQRRLLEEASKSCARLSALLARHDTEELPVQLLQLPRPPTRAAAAFAEFASERLRRSLKKVEAAEG